MSRRKRNSVSVPMSADLEEWTTAEAVRCGVPRAQWLRSLIEREREYQTSERLKNFELRLAAVERRFL